MKGPVVLLGPPGAGKSAAGARAARQLAMPFIDLDEASGDAGQLWRSNGEAAFRVSEVEALRRVLDGSDVLVAAGSGVVETEQARRLLEERALCVWLEVSPGAALARLQADGSRPWLPAEPRAAHQVWTERVRLREPWWQELAAARVAADGPIDAVTAALGEAIRGLRPIRPARPDAQLASSPEEALAVARGRSPALVVMDGGVAAAFPALSADVVVPGGEPTKTLLAVERLARALVAAGARRDTWIIAVGGGAVLDAVGLCAALLFRGVPWAAVPTTLLAQADAGIGGKTAVDLDGKKNLLGAFHAPARTVIAPAFLAALPEPLLHAGRVEMLKHELLASDAPADGTALVAPDPVMRSLAVKSGAVRRDPQERGLRAALNLGHTLGHALEAVFGISHGHAVQHGLRATLRLSVDHAGLPADVAAVLDARVRAIGPLAPLPQLDKRLPDVIAHLAVDKKADAAGARWILLEAPGLPVRVRVPPEAVLAAARVLAD